MKVNYNKKDAGLAPLPAFALVRTSSTELTIS